MSRRLDLSQLKINRIIVHDVPKHKFNHLTDEPTYSDKEGTLTSGLRVFFKTKITQALSSDRSIKVVYDEQSISPVSTLVERELESPNKNTFVQFSKDVTRHLFTIQKGNNSGGIVVIMDAELGEYRNLLIMKLEKDNGVQIKINEETHSIDIEVVDDLMLTNKTKVFKIALLMNSESYDFAGQIMDYQVDLKQKNNLSTFFMSDFLGCKPYKDPKSTTQQFYNYTKAFIQTIDDDVIKTKYIQDLNSYIQRNINRLSARTFADDYFTEIEHKNNYQDYLRNKNFSMAGFIKDTSLIDNKVKTISMEFENGITLYGNKGTLEDKVKLTNVANGKLKAEIISKLNKIN